MVDVTVQPSQFEVTLQPALLQTTIQPQGFAATVATQANTATLEPQVVVVTPQPQTVEIIEVAEQGPAGPPGSSGGSSSRIAYPFTQANLSIAGILPVFHLDASGYPSGVTVLDGEGEEVDPDEVMYTSPIAFAVRLISYVPLQGNWQILYSL